MEKNRGVQKRKKSNTLILTTGVVNKKVGKKVGGQNGELGFFTKGDY